MRLLLSSILLAGTFAALCALSGCHKLGFHEIDVSAKRRASAQMAREVMADLQEGLHHFYLRQHHYPATTEAYLYDSIQAYLPTEIDPINLYRNDNGKGYFIAIGARSERIIYRYPPTIGIGDYTLYWVGPNGVDEEGEGDDVGAWQSADSVKRYARRCDANMQNDGEPDKLLLVSTGSDIYLDSVRFEVVRGDTTRYTDSWPLAAYFQNRPELTDEERKEIIRSELDRFFSAGAFVHTDSLLSQGIGRWLLLLPNSPELKDIIRSKEPMFNYYAGGRGSKGIAWLQSEKKFVVVWKSE